MPSKGDSVRGAGGIAGWLGAGGQWLRWVGHEHVAQVRKWTGRRRAGPLMRCREADLIVAVLTALRPRRCLEWGAGSSTRYFPRLLPAEAKWIAIEHDPAWAQALREGDLDPRVELVHVPPNRYPWTDSHGDGSAEDLVDYVARPGPTASFDFILVDGRARVACVRRARDLLRPDGCVVLHDANRPHYRAAIDVFPRGSAILDHRMRKGGLWLGGVDRDPADLLEVRQWRRAWSLCRVLGRVIRC